MEMPKELLKGLDEEKIEEEFEEEVIVSPPEDKKPEPPKPEKKPKEDKPKKDKSKKSIWIFVFGVIAVLGLLTAGFSAYQTFNMQKTLDGSNWVCVQKKCTQMQTEEEWIYENCYLKDKDDTTCELEMNGQIFEDVPRPAVISPTVLKCKQSTCLLSTVMKMENRDFWEEQMLNEYEALKK